MDKYRSGEKETIQNILVTSKTVLTEKDRFFCFTVSKVIDKVGTILNVSRTIAKTQLIAFSRTTFCDVMTNPLIVKHRNVFGD